ncbi:MAG: COX15/CtaA family protein [Opitutales bacterium]
MSPTFGRTADYKPGLFAFCVFAFFWITLLLFAGGFTTSIQAGMAFLDWPLSNGSLNPEGWLNEPDKMAEHSHRLLGTKIGLLCIGLFVWTWLREERAWVRMLARLLLLVVILQGVLGGARVRFDQLNLLTENNFLAQGFAVTHACGAQVVVGLLVALSLACSRRWIEGNGGFAEPVPNNLRRWGILACILLFLQILVGAVMRHTHAGLAIPRFPLAHDGSLLPAYWNFEVSIHFAHRVGALLAAGALCGLFQSIWRHAPTRASLGLGASLIAALLALQIYLGALTIWTLKNPHVTTAHVLVGAFLLASTWWVTFLSYHPSTFKRSTPAGNFPSGSEAGTT